MGSWCPGGPPRARILANLRICYHSSCGVARLLRSGAPGEFPRPGARQRSGLAVPRRPADSLRAHREPLSSRPRGATARHRRRSASRDASGLGRSSALPAGTRSHGVPAYRRFHAVHDRHLSRACRAHSVDPLLRRPGQTRLPLCVRARPRELAGHRRRSAALSQARRPVRALRWSPRLRAPGLLHRSSSAAVLPAPLRMTDPVASLDPTSLRGLPENVLDERLRAFANEHGAGALPALSGLAEGAGDRAVRRAAKRALYRLSQRGVTPAPPPPPAPVVQRRAPRAVRAWLSGIDGSGSRAAWILFEGPYGGGALCSLILNDVVGITEVAGGDITKKRLEAELASLRAAQKLPWVETETERALGLVAESLRLHDERGTAPPAAFGRWQPFFAEVAPAGPPPLPAADPSLADRSSVELLGLPEIAGWFLDPDSVQSDALDVQEARESRLVVSDQIKAERQEAILGRVIEREFTPEARRRWGRRFAEMAWIFDATT